MHPHLRRPLLAAALAAAAQGCEAEPRDLPDPPSEEALAACAGQSLGEEDFDWSCCDVWRQQCESEGDTDCEWICNG